MERLWKFLDEMDVRTVILAAFNAGIVYYMIRKYMADIRKLNRYKAWSLPILTRVKGFHEAKYPQEHLGEDWKEEG